MLAIMDNTETRLVGAFVHTIHLGRRNTATHEGSSHNLIIIFTIAFLDLDIELVKRIGLLLSAIGVEQRYHPFRLILSRLQCKDCQQGGRWVSKRHIFKRLVLFINRGTEIDDCILRMAVLIQDLLFFGRSIQDSNN
jgi:hypothetical protein